MISDFIAYLTAEKRYSAHTVTAYENDLSQFAIYVRATYSLSSPSDSKPIHIRSWMSEMVINKVSSRSINRKLSTLRSYFNYLIRQGTIEHNPLSKVKTPKIPKRLPTIIQEKHLDKLFDMEQMPVPSTFRGMRDHLVVDLLYTTGMRRMELINLKLSDLDQANSWLKVLGKGNKERLIPVSGAMVAKIFDYQDAKEAQFEEYLAEELIVTNKGKKLYPKFVYNTVTRYLKQVSTATKRSPHTLRHSFATHMMNNGADLNAVKELLGHSSLAATQVYTHNSIQKLKDIYGKAHPRAQR